MGCWIELGSRKNEHDARIKTDTSAANNHSLSLRLNLYVILISLLSLSVPVSQATVCNEGSCLEFMVGSDPCKILRVTKLPRPGPRREIFEHTAGSPACSRTASSRHSSTALRSNPLKSIHGISEPPHSSTALRRQSPVPSAAQ